MNVIETAVMAEQNFLKSFFRIPYPTTPDTSGSSTKYNYFSRFTSAFSLYYSVIDTILSDLFEGLVPRCKDMINEADKMDNLYVQLYPF